MFQNIVYKFLEDGRENKMNNLSQDLNQINCVKWDDITKSDTSQRYLDLK